MLGSQVGEDNPINPWNYFPIPTYCDHNPPKLQRDRQQDRTRRHIICTYV